MKHKGYNNVTNGGNSTAQKFKYNGIELEEITGLYEMDLRAYDPAIARWTGIDPVTHHSMSTYTAFDNNPVIFADPSGADSVNPQELFDNAKSGMTTFDGNGNQTGYTSDKDCKKNPEKCKKKKENNSTIRSILVPKGTQVLQANNTFGSRLLAGLFGRTIEIDGIYYDVDSEGRIIRISPRSGLGIMAFVGSGGLNILKFRGLIQNKELLKLTHHQLVNAFKNTGFKLSNHAIKQLKNVRTKNLGLNTLNDFKQIINKGSRTFRDGKAVYSHKGMEVIVNPKTKVIITVKPANLNPR